MIRPLVIVIISLILILLLIVTSLFIVALQFLPAGFEVVSVVFFVVFFESSELLGKSLQLF
jgi:hypothetical protein